MRVSGGRQCAVMLAPGASATREHPSLLAMEAALTAVGIPALRIDLPSRRSDAAVTAMVADQAGELTRSEAVDASRIVLGGRSYGGRMCSMAVAGGLEALALVLVSYPLHPPGRPEKLRTAHFPHLQVPCLFVSGTRDAFGSPAELEEATTTIPGGVDHRWIQGGDHGLRVHDDEVARIVAGWVEEVVAN